MTTSLALQDRKHGRAPSPEADIKVALATLARNAGNMLATSKELDIPRSTLRVWRDKYRPLYVELAERLSVEVDQAIIESCRQTSLRAMQKAGELVDKVDSETDPNPARSSQYMATVAGISADKSLLMHGKATSIHAVASVEEDLRFLRSRAIPDAQVIDVEAETEPS